MEEECRRPGEEYHTRVRRVRGWRRIIDSDVSVVTSYYRFRRVSGVAS